MTSPINTIEFRPYPDGLTIEDASILSEEIVETRCKGWECPYWDPGINASDGVHYRCTGPLLKGVGDLTATITLGFFEPEIAHSEELPTKPPFFRPCLEDY